LRKIRGQPYVWAAHKGFEKHNLKWVRTPKVGKFPCRPRGEALTRVNTRPKTKKKRRKM